LPHPLLGAAAAPAWTSNARCLPASRRNGLARAGVTHHACCADDCWGRGDAYHARVPRRRLVPRSRAARCHRASPVQLPGVRRQTSRQTLRRMPVAAEAMNARRLRSRTLLGAAAGLAAFAATAALALTRPKRGELRRDRHRRWLAGSTCAYRLATAGAETRVRRLGSEPVPASTCVFVWYARSAAVSPS
jgi:hypothetical protein